MFGSKNNSQKQAIQSLVGAGTVIQGNISFTGGLRIDGTVKGNIIATDGSHSMLVVSEQAKIEGEVKVAHLIVNGSITGPVHATQLIELQPKAKVIGDVVYMALEMHHGALVSGMLKHTQQGHPQLALPAPELQEDLLAQEKSDKKTTKKLL